MAKCVHDPMLNPSFSKSLQAKLRRPYVATEEIANSTLRGNEAFDTGHERRLQSVYAKEIWLKLDRAGLSEQVLTGSSVLEVCAGTGFLSYHLLSRCRPRLFTINDISAAELNAAQSLIGTSYPDACINWVIGDLHTIEFEQKFDVIIGNSFLHHFHDVPRVLRRFAALLNPGGIFISLHEPTPMSTVVEGAKLFAWPLAVVAPTFVNDVVRARYKGEPSSTDLWMFEPRVLSRVARSSGFSSVITIPWHLVRAFVVQRKLMHLSEEKPLLSRKEQRLLWRAIEADSTLNRVLPDNCFGSICLVCHV